MPTGFALTIGLNSIDPTHYAGWEGHLTGCEYDAEDMTEVAKSKGFDVKKLLTKDATVANVEHNLLHASQQLKPGDLFLLTYSGHGGQVPDKNNDEVDLVDETWCLYDRQFLDDELYYFLSGFKEGVRILVFIDCCHSGTVTRSINTNNKIDILNSNVDSKGNRYKFAPKHILAKTFKKHREIYNNIQLNTKLKDTKSKVKASTIMISSCQSNEFSQDGDFNGLFTSNLLDVWKEGTFKGSYKRFHKSIIGQMPPDQTPMYILTGKINRDFEKQYPFTI